MSKSAKKTNSKKTKKTNYRPFFLHYFYCLAIMILLLITSFNINNHINSQKVLGAKVDYSPLQIEKLYWQRIIDKSPTFVDGYLELAKINMEMGEKDKAESYIKKAIELDPNSAKIPEVIQKLSL